jgi:ParB family transcriptional regulator, chromosome partitioning protein
MQLSADSKVQLIPIDRITLVNPRDRNQRVFQSIVENISRVGLKRPVTVSKREEMDGPRYDLVCGQGRLEAYRALRQSEIPAIVIDDSTEDCVIMSLVENVARRQHHAIALLQDLDGLKRRGYTEIQIAKKTGLSTDYVRDVSKLLEMGEHRLLRAVESGRIPLTVAIHIVESGDADVQRALKQAYEDKLLRGRKLIIAQRLIEQRRLRGKGLRKRTAVKRDRNVSSAALLRTYQQDTEKKRLIVRKAELVRNKLIFVTQALRILLADEHFVTLLRAEGMNTLPRNLVERMQE